MGNPITDLWHTATAGWKSIAGRYVYMWSNMQAEANLSRWEQLAAEAITALSEAVEYSTTIIATSDIDTISIVRDGLQGAIGNFRHLRWPVLPRYLYTAELYAYQEAVRWGRRAEAYARRLVTAEHAAMERRVLGEELARLVEVADTWARLHTEIGIEAYNRVQGDDQVRADLTGLVSLVRQEILARLAQAVRQLTAQVTQVRQYAQSIPGLEDSRATAGYNPTLAARAGAGQRLLDLAVTHDPLIADLVTKLSGWLVDLAEIDDPLVRIGAQLVLKQVTDRLGLDTTLRALVQDTVGEILGHGPPKTLQDVTASAGRRLDGAEDGLAQLAPLAGEADALAEMGTLLFDTALLGYFTAAVADPAATADDTVAAFDPVVTPLLAPVRALLGMP